MTCVCSVGLDMIAVPGDTTAETISAIIADEAAIGMVNSKTTAVRLIPAPGKKVGDTVEFGGLLGSAPVHARASLLQRGLHPAGRADPGPHAEPQELREALWFPSIPSGGVCLVTIRCDPRPPVPAEKLDVFPGWTA